MRFIVMFVTAVCVLFLIQLRISDPRAVWIMVHERNRWTHYDHGFIGSFNAPWSRQISDHCSESGSPQRNAAPSLWTTMNRPAPGRLQFVEINTVTSRTKVSLPPPSLYWNDFSQSNIRSRYRTAVYIRSDLNYIEIPYDVEFTVTLFSHPVPNTHRPFA